MHIDNKYLAPGTPVVIVETHASGIMIRKGVIDRLLMEVTADGTTLMHKLVGEQREYHYHELHDVSDHFGRGWWPTREVGEIVLKRLGIVPEAVTPPVVVHPVVGMLAALDVAAQSAELEMKATKPIEAQPE